VTERRNVPNVERYGALPAFEHLGALLAAQAH
jgi:hypothetical protein